MLADCTHDWQVLAYVWMPNHIHLIVRTPKLKLSRRMQYLLSGYANWYAKRYQRTGHLFQGRFKAELVEDESNFWTLSRYVHLNPVRRKRPLTSLDANQVIAEVAGYFKATPASYQSAEEKGTGVVLCALLVNCRFSITKVHHRRAMMPRQKRVDEAGVCYHAINRGNARQEIFHKPED